MKRSTKNLIEHSLETVHGELAEIVDFYFDESLRIRYVLIETGNWPFRRNALIPVEAMDKYDWDQNMFLINLTQEQILTSPKIDATNAISPELETDLLNHYLGNDDWGPGSNTDYPGTRKNNGHRFSRNHKSGITLCSTREVTGYHVSAIDGGVGVVEDFIVDDDGWRLHSVVISIERWMQGKKVIISPQSITGIDRKHAKVLVNLSEIVIKNSLPYETARVVISAGHQSQQG